ncbi:DUF397 domain-containing protein [Nocardiopsis sp. CC223A]|uniref:DUF397 domain-containing protein n=1 Tax=Nocardiopsis sp. CC223A TaxID=3044051 RepID=UPI00278C8666|nr:DUF397 domain-containing protein [Nocardiopsis sp. CC223A]
MDEWRKSTYSNCEGNCVEVRETPRTTDVRDTRHREAGHLSFAPGEWSALLRSLTR